MNKLNLLLFASILSIQTPVINQAYAQGTQQEDIDQEEEVQAELSANDFQNMNEADFDSIDDGIKRHIHRKLSELGNGYQVAFFKNDHHVVASIFKPKEIHVDTRKTNFPVDASGVGNHEVSFFYKNGTTKDGVTKIDNKDSSTKTKTRNYSTLLSILGKDKKKHIGKQQLRNHLDAKAAQRREIEAQETAEGLKQREERIAELKKEQDEKRDAIKEQREKRNIEREEARKETQRKFEQENVASKKAAAEYDKDKKEFSWPGEKDDAERKASENTKQQWKKDQAETAETAKGLKQREERIAELKKEQHENRKAAKKEAEDIKKGLKERQEDAKKEKSWYDNFWGKGTSPAKKQDSSTRKEAAIPTEAQKEADRKATADKLAESKKLIAEGKRSAKTDKQKAEEEAKTAAQWKKNQEESGREWQQRKEKEADRKATADKLAESKKLIAEGERSAKIDKQKAEEEAKTVAQWKKDYSGLKNQDKILENLFPIIMQHSLVHFDTHP